MIEFRSIGEAEIEEIHRLQNVECNYELGTLFDNVPSWAPMTLEKVKESISETQKKDRSTMFAIWVGDEFVGVGAWSSKWDPMGPWNHVVIWPQHRRKGYGKEAAENLLAKTFLDSPAHAIDTGIEEWNKAGIGFIKCLGFTEAGRKRMAGIREGTYYDELMFDMLKSEYLARNKEAGQ